MHSYARSMPSGKSRGRQERLNSSRVPGFNRRDVIQTYCPSSSMTSLLPPAKGERPPYRRTSAATKQNGAERSSFGWMGRTDDVAADLERLYRTGYRRFLRVAIAIVGDEGAAHDAVQDGFAQALKSRASFRGEGPIEAWVWRIVVNAALA